MVTGATPNAVKAPPVIRPRTLAIALGAVVLFVGGLFGSFFYINRQQTIDTIAVLPFYSSDNKLAPLSEGLTEEVINAIADLPDLSSCRAALPTVAATRRVVHAPDSIASRSCRHRLLQGARRIVEWRRHYPRLHRASGVGANDKA